MSIAKRKSHLLHPKPTRFHYYKHSYGAHNKDINTERANTTNSYPFIQTTHIPDWEATSRRSCGPWPAHCHAVGGGQWRCGAWGRGWPRRRRRRAWSWGTKACKSGGRSRASARSVPSRPSRPASPSWTAPSICSHLQREFRVLVEKWGVQVRIRVRDLSGSTDGELFAGQRFDGHAAADGGQ